MAVIDPVTLHATGRTLTWFSFIHMCSAASHREEVRTLETKGQTDDMKYMSKVIACVISSACAFESFINEAFELVTAPNHFGDNAKPLASSQQARLATGWEFLNKPSGALKDRASFFLKTFTPDQFWGSDPWQSLDNLIVLRNALVHGRPQSSSAESASSALVEKRLCETFPKRYPTRPGALPALDFFPHQVLGLGCCDWSIETVRACATDVVRRSAMREWGLAIDAEIDAFVTRLRG